MSAEPNVIIPVAPLAVAPAARRQQSGLARAFRNPSVTIGGLVILIMIALGAAAPWLGTINPTEPHTSGRNKLPGAETTMRPIP